MSRCAACDHSCNFVAGDGPLPCDFMFIGDRPSKDERNARRPLQGMAGREFNDHYLSLAGLERETIYITNSTKCNLGDDAKADEKTTAACAGHHMPGEVAECQPKCIVLMGAAACSLVPKIELDKDYGIPIFIDESDSAYLGGYCGPVVPMFHPASGLHDTSQMIPLMADFERLGKWWRGKWSHATPPSKTEYRIVTDPQDLGMTMFGSTPETHFPKYLYLPVDCEDDCGTPWSVQYSPHPGRAFLIPASKPRLIKYFSDFVRDNFGGVLLHNAPGDLDDLDKLGIRVEAFRDTMQEAYHLGNQPQGLKALGWRLLGIRMHSWEDVVGPPSRAKMVDWLSKAWMFTSDNRVRVEKQLKTKLKVEYRPSQEERDIKRILSHAHKPEYDLWEKAEESGLFGDKMWLVAKILEKECGSAPRMSIANVPLDEAIQYACQDADVTGQVGAVLASMRSELVREGGSWSVDEGDWDQ